MLLFPSPPQKRRDAASTIPPCERLCLKFRDGFWTATIFGYAIFLEGAAAIHIHEIVKAGNWSENNAGPLLVADIAFPILLLVLLALSRRATVSKTVVGH
jgi:hypothetical protein